jgi:hypothetical protein
MKRSVLRCPFQFIWIPQFSPSLNDSIERFEHIEITIVDAVEMFKHEMSDRS